MGPVAPPPGHRNATRPPAAGPQVLLLGRGGGIPPAMEEPAAAGSLEGGGLTDISTVSQKWKRMTLTGTAFGAELFLATGHEDWDDDAALGSAVLAFFDGCKTNSLCWLKLSLRLPRAARCFPEEPKNAELVASMFLSRFDSKAFITSSLGFFFSRAPDSNWLHWLSSL